MESTTEDRYWDLIVKPKVNFFSINLKEVWRYRDLIFLFVKRDIVTGYKQTILGPLWILLQPIINTILFTVTFSKIANLSTQGISPALYYLTGTTLWIFFAEGINKNANTFTANASIFGKVYFPRLVMPISMTLSNLFKFLIQFLLFVVVWTVTYFTVGPVNFHVKAMLLTPFIVLTMGIMSLSIGLIITSLTTKYRDFNFLVNYLVQFLMYFSCIVIALPASGFARQALLLNPIVPLVECFKYAFLGVGFFSIPHILYSLTFTLIIFILAILIFNKTEKTFMDTV